MVTYRALPTALEIRHEHEVVLVEAWGRDSVRVRAAQHRLAAFSVGALDEVAPTLDGVTVTVSGDGAVLVNGDLTVEVFVPESNGPLFPLLRFLRTATGEELLSEQREHFWWPGARVYAGNRAGSPAIHQQFASYDDEKLFGMGQRTHGKLDHKGLALDLIQRNGEVSVPFVLSNRGYGFLWNSPAIGRVEFATNVTRWTADQAPGIDYWITTGASPREILSHYADATGHSPRLPEWASGFWQSKLRYRDQDELMAVAREMRERRLPLSVIVCDFFHWTAMGDFQFDRRSWPDPEGMIAELREMGVQLLVSIWPTISPLSENYEALRDGGMLVGVDQGVEFHQTIADKGMDVPMPVAFYDSTNPATRAFIWQKVKENYFDLGARAWWLDACEPELNPGHQANLSFYAGPGAEVAGIYPRDNARLFAEGMAAAGAAADTVLLSRSAWAGQQKYGSAVWSGDIPATWLSLQQQLRAGLSIAVAGIPWWTTDIGGFHGGNAEDETYRELIVRWFQYGAFCPLFRLHGDREPRLPTGWDMTGGPNEVWAYGEEAYGIIRDVMLMRERLRPYLHEQMDLAASDGLPPMRPLFVDFPDDAHAWEVDDVFLFGPDVLVAPILTAQTWQRSVYLPAGATWTDVWTDMVYDGGTTIDVHAPLERIPLFTRNGAALPITA